MDIKITMFESIYHKKPFYRDVMYALNRIKDGASKISVLSIRSELDKEKRNDLKSQLPAICFSGEFIERKDESLIKHSGLLVLDFDELESMDEMKKKLIAWGYTFAVWVSPSGNGLKCLVKIKNTDKHRDHFDAIKKIFPSVDKSGANLSRVCYESFDPEIFINENSKVFDILPKVEKKTEVKSTNDVFNNLLVWLTNRGDAFTKGERNHFIFKLASACCRYGMDEFDAINQIGQQYFSSEFTQREGITTIKSAYRQNANEFGSAKFENEKLISKSSGYEIDMSIFDKDIKPRDVIFSEAVKMDALNIFRNGYVGASPFDVPAIDSIFKFKRKELTIFTGVGNYGKSTWLKYMQLLKSIRIGEKWCVFSPEDFPTEEYYHDLTEMYIGASCTPSNPNQPTESAYLSAYDWVGKHFFYCYPQTTSPTPEYIFERFLEMIIKEKIDGVIIDPFNQMFHDYASHNGRDDKYLEKFLADCIRFAQENNVYFIIVAHPKGNLQKTGKNIDCPDVFDLAGGAMWNNKADNVIVYHRPFRGDDPNNPICEFHSKKIRRQKIVGMVGHIGGIDSDIDLIYDFKTRRFKIDGHDYIAEFKNEKIETSQTTFKIEPPDPDEWLTPNFEPTNENPF